MSNCAYKDENGEIYVKEHPDALPPIYSPLTASVSKPAAREIAQARIVWIWPAYLHEFPQAKFTEIVWARYNVEHPRLMTLEQLADLYALFRNTLMSLERRSA